MSYEDQVTVTTGSKTVTAYKGFDKDFKCRGFQYEVGKTYTHDGDVLICESGFHACTNPFDVWSYYGPANSQFAVVEMSEPVTSHNSDSKIASAEIHVKVKLSLPEFISHAIEHVIDLCSCGGGDDSDISGSEDYAKIGSSGYAVKIGSSGDCTRIGSSGDYARIDSSGINTVIACAGLKAKVRAKKGSAIAIPYTDSNGQTRFSTAVVGENGIEPDTWYQVDSTGNFVEVE